MKRAAVILALLVAVAPLLAAAGAGTVVEGRIRGPVTWGPEGSPYLIRGDVYIVGGLRVLPGTVIVFEEGASLTITGGASIQGAPGEPVVIAGNARVTVSGDRLEIAGVEVEDSLILSAGSSTVEAYNISGNTLILFRIVDSNVTLEGARLDWLLLGPGYTMEYLDTGDPAVVDSTVKVSNTIVYKAVAGRPPEGVEAYKAFPPVVPPRDIFYWKAENSTIIFSNVTLGYGLAGALAESRLAANMLESREIILAFVHDSKVEVNDSIIAYGRGIVVGDLKTVYSKSTILVYRSDVFNASQDWGNGTPTEAPIVVLYSDSSSSVIVSESWLNPPRVAGVNASINPSPSPVHEILPATLVLYPPLPLAGQPHRVTLDVEGDGKPILLVAMLEYEYGSSITVVPGNLTAELTTPQPVGDNVGLERLTLVAFYPGAVAGARETVIVLTGVNATARLVEPADGSIVAERRVTLTVAVSAPDRIRDYIRVLVNVDGASYEANKTANGVYTVTLELGEGAHEWNATILYGETVLDETATWRFTVDYTPPTITYTQTATGLEITVSDNTTGVANVTVRGPDGKILYRKSYTPAKQSVTVRLAVQQGPVAVEAWDAAGNHAVETIVISKAGGETTTTTSPEAGGGKTTTTGRLRAGVPSYTEESDMKLYLAAAAVLLAAAILAARRRRRKRPVEEYVYEPF